MSTPAHCPYPSAPQFTTVGLEGQQSEVRRFRPGLDYTVAHYGVLTKDPQLDAGAQLPLLRCAEQGKCRLVLQSSCLRASGQAP